MPVEGGEFLDDILGDDGCVGVPEDVGLFVFAVVLFVNVALAAVGGEYAWEVVEPFDDGDHIGVDLYVFAVDIE